MHSGAVKVARRLAVLGLVIAVPALADAPPDQYEPFTENATTIVDRHTLLVWARSVPFRQTFLAAQQTCQNADMRLPSYKELLTIVDEEPHLAYEGTQNVSKYIDRAAFPKTPSGPFWSSSIVEGDVWTVDFQTGQSRRTDPAQTGFVRCVDTP